MLGNQSGCKRVNNEKEKKNHSFCLWQIVCGEWGEQYSSVHMDLELRGEAACEKKNCELFGHVQIWSHIILTYDSKEYCRNGDSRS